MRLLPGQHLPGQHLRAALPRAAAVAQVPAAPAQCDFSSGAVATEPDRFTSCSDLEWELFTTVTSGGLTKLTGEMDLEDLQWNSYQNATLSWTHGLLVLVDSSPTGVLAKGTPATISSGCSGLPGSGCGVAANLGLPDTTQQSLAPRATISDGWTEQDTGSAAAAAGAVDTLPQLGAVLAGPGSASVPAWKFIDAGALVGRCDSVVGTSGPRPNVGCVNENFTDTLTLSLAQGGASAAMVAQAQKMSAHWGLKGVGQPLHRLQNAANRDIICDDGSFTQDPAINTALVPYGTKDSCDEFPFNSTYESGAMTTDADGNAKPSVTSGAQCEQVTSVQTGTSDTPGALAADWHSVQVTGSPANSEPCIRGHIPLSLNSSVGGSFSAFIQKDRLLDKDPFWIAVTA
jgi:hypothetical protein